MGFQAIQSSVAGGNPGLSASQRSKAGADQLSAEERQQLGKLQATDRKVKAHEQAHVAAGGELIRGGAAYSYETGPDRQRYAVAGDVSIDASEGRTPEETISRAQRIRNAALAPADPSAQDRQVAAQASRMEMQARLEAAMRAAEERGQAEDGRAKRAVGAYQAAGGLESSVGFSAVA